MSFYREFVRSFLINYEKSVDFAVELGYIIAHIAQDPTLSNASVRAVRFIHIRI